MIPAMGLNAHRQCLAGVADKFHIDSWLPIVEAAAEVCGVKYGKPSATAARPSPDHRITLARSVFFPFTRNVYPGARRLDR